MAFREDLDNLSTDDIQQPGDSWAAKVVALLTSQLTSTQEMARQVETNEAEIEANAVTAAASDLSNVSPSDLARNMLPNPASLPNGTLLQVIDGNIEPLAQSSLDFPGPNFEVGERTRFEYRVGNRTPTNQDYRNALAAFFMDGGRAEENRIIVGVFNVASGSTNTLLVTYLPITRYL